MLTTVTGYYDHGNIVLNEKVSVADKTEVIVTFLNMEAGGGQKNA